MYFSLLPLYASRFFKVVYALVIVAEVQVCMVLVTVRALEINLSIYFSGIGASRAGR